MTGNDDGDFSPHPGDPWHPGWHPDAEESDGPAAQDPSGDDAPAKKKKKNKKHKAKKEKRQRRKRSRRDGTGDPAAASGVADSDENLLEDLPPPIAAPIDDPFDAVLRAEGRSVRRRSSTEDGPAPDWTSDDEIPDDLTLPVSQPSWVGDSTASGDGIEAPEFEPVGSDPAEIIAEQPDLFPASDDSASSDPASVESDDARDSDSVGEFGVAGPEAFDALTETAEEDLGEWAAFMDGSVPVDTSSDPDFGTPAEPVGDLDALDEWVEAEPKPKRRWFHRSSSEDVPIDEGGQWAEDESAEVIEQPLAADPAASDLVSDAAYPDVEDPAESLTEADALAEALAALGVDDEVEVEPLEVDSRSEVEPVTVDEEEVTWSLDDAVAVGDEIVDESAAIVEHAEPIVPDDEVFVQAPVDEEDADAEATADPVEDSAPMFLGEMPTADGETASVEPHEQPTDWDGDPSRVPASWFAEVDEDAVVPPPAADTPETEWPADEGPWEGTAAWKAEEPTEVFDVESAATPSPVQPTPMEEERANPSVSVPEGYQDWGDAVAEATSEVGDETAEYHVQHISPTDTELPEGFEPFPGSEAASVYGDAADVEHGRDHLMGESDDTPIDPPSRGDDTNTDDVEFDESIYASGGTIEHRGLAEAIAAVGDDDDTEWQAMSAAMPGLETGVLGFEDVADLAQGEEYVAPVRSNFAARVATGLVLLALLIGSMFVGDWAFVLFVGAITLLGLGELYSTLSRRGFLPLSLFGMAGATGTLVATWFHGPIAIPSGIMLTAVVVFFFYAFAPTRRDALTNGGVTVLGVAWAVGGIAFAIPIARGPEFEALVLAVVVATAAMDVGAYSFGRRWGKRPLAPVLSPNKTLEGLFGGALLAMSAAAAFGYFEIGPFDLASGLGLGLVVSCAAPLGDLAESMIKRGMGVKDMGSTLPGHGGVFDRIDALLFVIPSAWVLFETIGYLG